MNERMKQYLAEILTQPGTLSESFRLFHNFSFGNQISAYCQLKARKIQVGPIATYKNWQAQGRQVKKGEKAIELCMPVINSIVKKNPDGTEDKKQSVFFIWRPFWFAFAQTTGEGNHYHETELPLFDYKKALENLKIQEIPFDTIDGTMGGYANEQGIAINPAWPTGEKIKVAIHEIAHKLLEHVGDSTISKPEKELEAEGVAYIIGQTLNLPGASDSRGYCQHWYHKDTITEKSANRILSTVDKILKAGTKGETNGE